MKKNHRCGAATTHFWMDRREFLGQMGTGLPGIALALLLREQGVLAGNTLSLSQPYFSPKARRVIQIFCPGGVSQMDTFDYKPELQKRSGEPMPGEENAVSFTAPMGNLLKSPFSFQRRGKSAKWVCDLLPQLGELVDDMAFIHSVTAKTS